MKKFAILLFVILSACKKEFPRQVSTAAPGGPPPCTPPEQALLAVPLTGQQTGSWCWAASGQMVMQKLGKNVTQCDEADKYFHRVCCDSGKPKACINGGWPPFGAFGFEAKITTNAALPWDDIRKEIGCNQRPIAFSWKNIGTGGHMMTLIGYGMTGGTPTVMINDPWPPGTGESRPIPYETYVSMKGKYTHWNDYYEVEQKAP